MEIKKFIKEKILFLSEELLINEKEDYLELKEKIFENINIRLAILFCYAIGAPLLVYLFGLRIKLLEVEFMIFWMIFYTIVFYPVVKKELFKTVKRLSNVYLIYLILDLVWLTIIIHFFGGLTWVGMVFLTYYIIFGYLVFPKYFQGFIMFWAVLTAATAIGLIDYLGILEQESLFAENQFLQKDINFLLATYVALFLALYFVANWNYIFSRRLKKEKTDLREKKIHLEEKTKELEEKTAEVEKGAKKLQEKIEEMEKFQKLLVGRELKMIDLKEEIKKLKKE